MARFDLQPVDYDPFISDAPSSGVLDDPEQRRADLMSKWEQHQPLSGEETDFLTNYGRHPGVPHIQELTPRYHLEPVEHQPDFIDQDPMAVPQPMQVPQPAWAGTSHAPTEAEAANERASTVAGWQGYNMQQVPQMDPFAGYVGRFGRSFYDFVKAPGQALRHPETYNPTEGTDWGAGAALSMIGTELPFAKGGTAGIAGGALKQPERFVSRSEKAIDKLDMQSATPQRWLSQLRNQGVSNEEMQWTGGLDNWLKSQSGRVSKEDLQKYIADNKVRVGEVNYGHTTPENVKPDDEAIAKYGPQWQQIMDQIRPLHEAIANYSPDPSVRQNAMAAVKPLHEQLSDIHRNMINETINRMGPDLDVAKPKYEDNPDAKPLPGGDPGSYREKLITLDTGKHMRNRIDEIHDELNQLHLKTWDEQGSPDWMDRWNALEAERDRLEAHPAVMSQPFRGNHWSVPDVLAHVRYDTRNLPNGEKTLHMAEIQSDWHQKGREQGYKGTMDPQLLAKTQQTFDNALLPNRQWLPQNFQIGYPDHIPLEQIGPRDLNHWLKNGVISPEDVALFDRWNKANNASLNGVPNAPFKNVSDWTGLAMKRMIREAAEKDIDHLSWDSSQTNADRYGLERHVSEMHYNTKYGVLRVYDHNGQNVVSEKVSKENLPDYIGKEATKKLLSMPLDKYETHHLVGQYMKIGGEGMREYYDRMLPDVARKIGKKYGASIGQSDIDGKPIHYLKLTPELKQKALNEGFSLFAVGKQRVGDILKAGVTGQAPIEAKHIAEAMPKFVERDKGEQQRVIDYWNENLKGVDPHEFVDGLTSGIKSDGDLKHLTAPGNRHSLNFESKLYNDWGTPIGTLSRILRMDDKSVYHDGLSINTSGRGLGKKLLASQINLYNKLGLNRADLFADAEIGGYAWAKYGWLPTKNWWEGTLRDNLNQRLNFFPAVRTDLKMAVKKLIKSNDPRSIWPIADLKEPVVLDPNRERSPGLIKPVAPMGKALLLNNHWDGALDLTDKHAMDRFWQYVGDKK
jgi:hypothetical protein